MLIIEFVFGPLRQFLIGIINKKFDENGDLSPEYMETMNNAIPRLTQKIVDKVIDIIYPPKKYTLGLCHRIWNTERLLYAILWYRWYSPQQIESDTDFD